jgi:hypothetical protein
MVAILTYDDAVRRLIFGKKLHNHDVLAGLLLTLQARLKSKPTPTNAAISSNSTSTSSLIISRKSKWHEASPRLLAQENPTPNPSTNSMTSNKNVVKMQYL